MANAAEHLPDFDLIQFADGEMPVAKVRAAETHLRACAKCRGRLEELRRGADAYEQYHAQVLKPALPVPEEWPNLSIDVERPRHSVFPWRAAAAVLACGILAGGWMAYLGRPAHRMQQVLAQAVSARTRPHGRLRISANGHSWYRSASFGSMNSADSDRTRALFVRAHYSWDDPLSARSFAAWRKQLPERHDQVVSMQSADGRGRFYRVQTEAPAGILRSAALTLRADTFEAVRGAFHFDHQNDVDIEDAEETPELAKGKAPGELPPLERPAVARHVTPAEELRVFAALNAIGADVGEPVSVDTDAAKEQIVITGVGLTPARERQIRDALASLPNTALRFNSRQPAGETQRQPSETTSQPADGAPLRSMFETEAGGAMQFQDLADKALEASSAILAQANALDVLARTFPAAVAFTLGAPDRETLRLLRRKHAIAVEQQLVDLSEALRPLLPPKSDGDVETQKEPGTSWELGSVRLLEMARILDGSLARLLAGSYSRDAGQEILHRVPDEIGAMEALARVEESAR